MAVSKKCKEHTQYVYIVHHGDTESRRDKDRTRKAGGDVLSRIHILSLIFKELNL
jgi:hypothetical protein